MSIEKPQPESPNKILENHLNEFRQHFENTQGDDQFTFVKNLTGSSFEANNASRISRGVDAYSEKEYVEAYIQAQENSIEESEKIIVDEKEWIKKLGEKLNLNGESEEVKKLKVILQSSFGGSENFGGGKEQIEEVASLIRAYEETYDQDALLDKLSETLKYIQLQEESMQLNKDILRKINELEPVKD